MPGRPDRASVTHRLFTAFLFAFIFAAGLPPSLPHTPTED